MPKKRCSIKSFLVRFKALKNPIAKVVSPYGRSLGLKFDTYVSVIFFVGGVLRRSAANALGAFLCVNVSTSETRGALGRPLKRANSHFLAVFCSASLM